MSKGDPEITGQAGWSDDSVWLWRMAPFCSNDHSAPPGDPPRSRPSHDGRSFFLLRRVVNTLKSQLLAIHHCRAAEEPRSVLLFWNLTLKEQPVPRSPGLKHRKALVHFSALIQLPVSRLSPPTSHTLLMLQLVSHYAASESHHCWSLKTSRSRFLAVWLGFVHGESSRPHVAGILISCFCHQNLTLRP